MFKYMEEKTFVDKYIPTHKAYTNQRASEIIDIYTASFPKWGCPKDTYIWYQCFQLVSSFKVEGGGAPTFSYKTIIMKHSFNLPIDVAGLTHHLLQ